MATKMHAPRNGNHWQSHLKLAVICVLVGIMVHLFGSTKYLSISIFISLGIGFSIRFSRYWLITQYPDMRLWLQYFYALVLAFLVWGVAPILLKVMAGPGDSIDSLQNYLGIFFIGSLAMALVSFVYYRSEQTLALKQALFQAELEQVKKDKLLLETELRLLQSQIEPHFLFNTLATIQALIAVDSRQASEMLTALTSLLRQSLDRTRTEWLTLEHELQFNKAYLAIQKIRLGERLKLEYDISDQLTDDIMFPPMLLQPLLENAVTHGIEQLKNGGTLTLSIKLDGQNLIITIINHCKPGGSQHTGAQVGLNNVQQRLAQLYAERAKLSYDIGYDNSAADLVRVTLEVPIHVASD
ncbi:histidine kinase [Aliidiomarina minuta]|uniref:Histidine kinase n=1 Tax=Aliidiomarina minuta TaxID=880057 RepID=A0A432W9Q3_9GAMM|nr:histidine kinase [Aliidiomarina minuta]RUO26880.1 histidine kinase [Aliidiomarina minuta]